MSYARHGERGSDIYAYHGFGAYTTVIVGGLMFRDRTRRAFYDRLLRLKSAGIKVPARALNRLRGELGL